ncbi:hypothetical protein FPE01S_03_06670 [Flavihumibacter petaseus NBRC 106054]|uniref:Major facilitator superfamily transporter n=2 Tax=Flavihumibacter TaxID=1004301 RepID=A0A0E9N4B3_9BACT|nr:hypothetical protein FPE01S_03_06670 [Flavihumibacter petaseus NBRC 106054]
MVAAFGTYFCMYAFRKPFNSGVYEGLFAFGLEYKAVLIIAQVLGYMVSKFLGIKVISELQPQNRRKLIIALILVAEVSLVLFGLVPHPYNFVFLFFNGLPLGMVWGIIFSYLEGRRFTEMLGMGLSISLIVSSGILKTVYFNLHDWLPAVSEFWMPALVGLAFLPAFFLFVWMLSVIPEPTETDKLLRSERLPMTVSDKRKVMQEIGLGVTGLVLIYSLLTTMRDFRDNFSVEIWREIYPTRTNAVFSTTEMIAGLVVLVGVGCLSMIRNNIRGFWSTLWLIAAGLLMCGGSTLLFQFKLLPPFGWMMLSGMGLFLAYVPIQVAVFERIIALFPIRANAGYFVYLCDATGYLGSVGLILYKEFFMQQTQWATVLMHFSYIMAAASLLLLVFIAVYFNRKLGVNGPVTKQIEKLNLLNP